MQVKNNRGEQESRQSYGLVCGTPCVVNFSVAISMKLFWNFDAFGGLLHTSYNRYSILVVDLGLFTFKCTS